MKDFRSLLVWQRAHELTLAVYKATKNFPGDERFGLTNQMRRSSSSVATNIAEGCGRGSNQDFNRFLQIAFGSSSELDYQLILTLNLAYLAPDVHLEMRAKLIEVQKMLASLMRKVQPEMLGC
ncbi:MAG: four helix bundle protein [Acidobacteriota bacterium]